MTTKITDNLKTIEDIKMKDINTKNMKMKDINTKNMKNVLRQGIILSIIFCSILIFSATIVSAAGQVVVDANRDVILDDPSGWVSSVGNRWNGESTTIRWYVLVLDSNGRAVPGVTVTTNLIRPNGIVNYSSSAFTDSNGYANFSRDLDNFNQIAPSSFEGNWTINATATVESQIVIGNDRIIYDEYGCGKSGSGCHSSNWQPSGKVGSKSVSEFGTGTMDSPYTKGWDSIHNQSGGSHIGSGYPHNGSEATILYGECLTCHKSYNGTYIGVSTRNNYQPQYGGGLHYGKTNATCVDCHAGFRPNGVYSNMPIKKCYDCHPKKNNNVSVQNYVQSNNKSYSYLPLDTANGNIRSHNSKDTVVCIACHDGGHNITKPNNYIAMSNTYTEKEQCWACHTNRPTHYPSSGSNCVSCHTQDAHKVSLGGGPDCISCHNATGIATHKVDVNAIALGEHANLNSGATASGVSIANKKCWGCHQTGGIQPTGMGDRYQNPYKCYDCHNATKPYVNINNALTVSEHFKNGTDIKAAKSTIDNSSSCILCHNLPEMKVSYTDNEFSNYSLASHYGKNRTDLMVGGNTSCIYCHQNISTVFSNAMANADNNNMSNHSTSGTTPVCTTCHGSGKLHDSSLSKPTDSSDTYCKSCHFAKKEHKALYCTECHANNTDGSKAGRDIHGIKFLQNDNTFSQSRTNVADCITCHQNTGIVEDSLGGFWPYKIGTLHHSDIINNGSKWGNYWTSGSVEACLYCHNDTKHSDTPLGRPLIWNTSYEMYTNIGSGTNCADCHYKRDSVYNAMKLTFEAKGLEIPPEITNGSWNGISGYFNHSLSSYTDSQCQSCHNVGSTTVGEMMHNASAGGAGGDICIECHGTNYTGANPIVTRTFVDIGAYNSSVHQNINATPVNTLNNNDCWSCHYNKDMNRQNVRKCGYCHNKVSQWHGNADITTNLTELTIR